MSFTDDAPSMCLYFYRRFYAWFTGRGKRLFCCIFTASYAIYWDCLGNVLFVLGVIDPQSPNPGPVMLLLLLITLIYNYSQLLPQIPISWAFSFFTDFSKILHVYDWSDASFLHMIAMVHLNVVFSLSYLWVKSQCLFYWQ